MADRPSDPFAPPDLTDSAADLQLDQRPPVTAAAAAATLADAAPEMAVRKPLAYKRPDGGVGTYMLWGLALVGLGVVVMFGARLLRGTVEGKAVAAKPAVTAPPAPVHWTSVGGGDNVLITVDVQPRQETRLLLDGAPMPSNPVSLPRGSRHTITGIAAGFAAADLELTADAAKSVRLRLQRAGR